MFNRGGKIPAYFNGRRIETLERAAGYRFFNSILPPEGSNSKTRPRIPAFALIVGCLRPAFPERESRSLFLCSSQPNHRFPPPSPSYGTRIILRNRVTPAAVTAATPTLSPRHEWVTHAAPRYVHAHDARVHAWSFFEYRSAVKDDIHACSHDDGCHSRARRQVENYNISNYAGKHSIELSRRRETQFSQGVYTEHKEYG